MKLCIEIIETSFLLLVDCHVYIKFIFSLSVEDENFKLELVDFLKISYKFCWFFRKRLKKIEIKKYNLVGVKLKYQIKLKFNY